MLKADRPGVVACSGPPRESARPVGARCHTGRVGRAAASLLDQIEADVLDNRAPLADALRKIVILGGQAGSLELREWASKELRGYQSDDDLPDYRKVGAPLKVNGINGRFHFTGQTISSSVLPDFAREAVNETLHLTKPIGEIEEMFRQAEKAGDAINLSPGGLPTSSAT